MESTQSPPRGKRLLALAINQIIEHPETHDQTTWHCGTKHCFGGHIQIMGGRECDSDCVERDMEELTGLEYEDVNWLCRGNRTKADLHGFVSSYLKGEDYFANAGYDRDGYNRAGYDRAGYDRDGYDRAGYNRDGYNRAGKPLTLLEVPAESDN